MEKLESNKLIAEFMGYRYETGVSLGGSWSRFFKNGGTFEDSFPGAKYHTSWDWLMPVVEKIEKESGLAIVISGKIVNIAKGTGAFTLKGETKIEAVYNGCLEYINRLNPHLK